MSERWGEHVLLGALFHSVYGTEAFPTRLFEPVDRARVQALLGERAELLAYLFHHLDRARFCALLPSFQNVLDVTLPCREQDVSISRESAQELAAILVANYLEQPAGPDGGPQIVPPYIRAAARYADVRHSGKNSAFRFLRLVDPDCERLLITEYRDGIERLCDDAECAVAAFQKVSAMTSQIAEPRIWLAYLALNAGQLHHAAAFADEALRILDDSAFVWDKRLTLDEWRNTADRIGASAAAGWKASEPFVPMAHSGASVLRGFKVAAATPPQPILSPRMSSFVADFATARTNNDIVFPGLEAKPWRDSEDVPVARFLTEHFAEIVRDYKSLPRGAFKPEREPIERTGSWDVLMILERGRVHPLPLSVSAALRAVVEQRDVIRGITGLTYISRLAPGTELAMHRGPTNVRLRCHLPLVVPSGDCAIEVGGVTRRWEIGRCLVFDDHLPHRAWNRTQTERVVLIVDVWNPDLGEDRVQAERFLGAISRQATAVHNYWNANERIGSGIASADSDDSRWL